MNETKTASLKHLIIALVVLMPLGLLPLFFMDNKPKVDPIAKAEELSVLLDQFTPEAKKQILKRVNVRDDRLALLPPEVLDQLVATLTGQPEKLAVLEKSKRPDALEKLLEVLDRREAIPFELQGVGIEEKLGAKLPLDLVFKDESGQKRPLGFFFQSGKPVILTLNYSDCPQLCHVQLNNFVEIMETNKILPGKDFEIVTVSINPNEGPTKARLAKKNYLKELNAPQDSWHFLTTEQDENIKKLAAIVGFKYKLDPVKRDYAHSSTLILCSPGGVVTQYYQGIIYDPKVLTQKINEARQGIQIASNSDEENLANCKVIDESKPFAAMSMRVMKISASIMAVGLLLTLMILWMLPNRHPVVLPPLQGVNQI
jgi:protein SCO1/2